MSDNKKSGREKYYGGRDWIGHYLSRQRNTAVLRHLSGHLVDLGCGDGQLIRAYNGQATGVDIENYGAADIVLEHFRSLPFETGSVDTVAIIASLNYFEEPVEVLKEVRRIVRDGGTLVITMPNAAIMKLWHGLREGWAYRPGYSLAELRELFHQSGWKIRERHSFLFRLNFVYIVEKSQ